MTIPMVDLRAQYATLRPEIEAAVLAVLERQQFRGGAEVEAFEEALAAYAGVRHALGVSSGTDALFLPLKALDLQAGDEVITTPFTFFATGGAIVNAGGIPVFADILPDRFTLDPEDVKRKLSSRTRCILPVHLYGQCAEMEILAEIAAENNLPIIEDAAQALGARKGDKAAGAWGMATALSFYPTKNLGAAGEGGAILTNDDALAAKLRLLRCHGASALYQHGIVGTNSHLHTIQAAVLQVKLSCLSEWNEQRRERARYYTAALQQISGITCPSEAPEAYHVYHQYVIRLPERDQAKALLQERGIGSGIFYPLPLHQQPCFKEYIQTGHTCPQAEAASKEVLALPIYPELTTAQQDRVIEALSDHCASLS
ncbi:MAG: DegT/DnrJ/EryC1/StrS family aminotransferase [Candidatus Hydrogenedens sp.]|nr:DegT/DnrJ/EryC1/StrS family aminotransferase [Candidatus Hydrogenedens sp.]